MPLTTPHIVKQIPILRFLIAVCCGIIIQYNTNIDVLYYWVLLCLSSAISVSFLFLPIAKQYVYRWIQGLSIITCFVALGGLLSFYKQDTNHKHSFLNQYQGEPVLLQLDEDFISKPKSFKANAQVVAMFKNNKWVNCTGKIIIYTAKDSVFEYKKMGDGLIISKPLSRVVNSGNPGGYNYARFCSFKSIYHQVYLTPKDVVFINNLSVSKFNLTINKIQNAVLNTLKKYIVSADAIGIAEALLIGYREDLDKDLVKAYSNTGVVHIIAISGMHLGMIYALLVFVLSAFRSKYFAKFIKPITIIFVLWLFAIVAGFGPSIVRSAIMFSFIVLGDAVDKKTNIFNSLALSAFIIILFQPFVLWDVGFQLSYAAVTSIALFNSYISRLIYVENKLLQLFFKLNAVTLSAQILTLPIVLYHFHQFPSYFLLTNLIAVPVSSFILFAEIGLLLVQAFTPLATWLGKVISAVIVWLNEIIVNSNSLPYASIENIHISIVQGIVLMLFVCIFSFGIMHKNKRVLLVGVTFFTLFMGIRFVDILQKQQQEKIIIYNVPSYTGIDIIKSNRYTFLGDSILQQPGFLQNFHIKPSRILHRLQYATLVDGVQFSPPILSYKNKKILIVNNSYEIGDTTAFYDVVLITQNPKLYITEFSKKVKTNQLVFDGSNPLWKIELWQKDCINLHLPHHITAQQGAYTINF